MICGRADSLSPAPHLRCIPPPLPLYLASFRG